MRERRVDTPDFVVAIPARYASTRLPGKPLSAIAGVPMIVRVARRALAAGARGVVVATDDVRIADALAGEPVTVCMTRADHPSGTDRLAECAVQLGCADDLIVASLMHEGHSHTNSVAIAKVKQIIFNGNDGEDRFTNHTAITSKAFGHAGNDTLDGGDGNDWMYGGVGDARD